MDFKLSVNGDLIKDEDNLLTVEAMEEKIQLAMCKIASVSHDWFYDNFGCDLEQLIGKPLNYELFSIGEEIIKNELIKLRLFDNEEIILESKKVSDEAVGFNVYITDETAKYYYYLIEVEIDIVGSVNVQYGGSVKCLF